MIVGECHGQGVERHPESAVQEYEHVQHRAGGPEYHNQRRRDRGASGAPENRESATLLVGHPPHRPLQHHRAHGDQEHEDANCAIVEAYLLAVEGCQAPGGTRHDTGNHDTAAGEGRLHEGLYESWRFAVGARLAGDPHDSDRQQAERNEHRRRSEDLETRRWKERQQWLAGSHGDEVDYAVGGEKPPAVGVGARRIQPALGYNEHNR